MKMDVNEDLISMILYIEVFLDVDDRILQERNKKGLYTGNEKNVVGKDIEVEFPKSPDIIINNDGSTPINESITRILEYTPKQNKNVLRETDYWNKYYLGNFSLNDRQSLFAEFVLNNYLKTGDRILEIGCGNGRDTLFFSKNGISVVAIDSSEIAISRLKEYKTSDVYFICDDFVNTFAVYQADYDAIYSRFTMHSNFQDRPGQGYKKCLSGSKRGRTFYGRSKNNKR